MNSFLLPMPNHGHLLRYVFLAPFINYMIIRTGWLMTWKACTGAAVEMITSGGEVAFIESLIKQSLVLKTQVLWYTSMFGKLSSVLVIVQKLLDNGIHNWAITEFVQGKATRRWAVGWSFSDWRPRSVSLLPSTCACKSTQEMLTGVLSRT